MKHVWDFIRQVRVTKNNGEQKLLFRQVASFLKVGFINICTYKQFRLQMSMNKGTFIEKRNQ